MAHIVISFQKKINSIDALYLLAKVGNRKFEFLFTPLHENKRDFSLILIAIHKYDTYSIVPQNEVGIPTVIALSNARYKVLQRSHLLHDTVQCFELLYFHLWISNTILTHTDNKNYDKF
jgi:hypothetical protein